METTWKSANQNLWLTKEEQFRLLKWSKRLLLFFLSWFPEQIPDTVYPVTLTSWFSKLQLFLNIYK